MPSVTLAAPAKLNLGLRVVGRREDGYHLLESLFVAVALADEILVETGGDAPGVVLDLEPGVQDVPSDQQNLAVAAARAYLAARTGPAVSVRIRLAKRVPASAGLGGGSSDAGAVLVGLARLLPDGPTGAELADIALGLGADVPFFLDPRPALVSGVGERIEPVAGLTPLWAALANPGIALSTSEVFRLYDALGGVSRGLTPTGPRPTMPAVSELFGPEGDPEALARLPELDNDLEPAAIRLCPPIARLRDRLREQGAWAVGMSGSGATVYGIFRSEAEAAKAIEGARFEAGTWTCVTRLRA